MSILDLIGGSLGVFGMLLTTAGIAIAALTSLLGDTLLTRYYRQYTAHLDRSLNLMFMPGSGQRIAMGQGAALVAIIGLAIWVDLPYWYAFAALTAVGPNMYLRSTRTRYIKKLEEQVDGMIMGLANSLKTVPSPSAAMIALTPILPVPMRLEIDRMLKEVRLGSTLEQGILNMNGRLKSKELDAALSALLIGLQVGGNLPVVLENTAATIREMARLQGVVRTKTAEARAQLWVLILFPFVICYGFMALDPLYFTPLQNTFLGNLITAGATVLWLASILVARKILKVDL